MKALVCLAGSSICGVDYPTLKKLTEEHKIVINELSLKKFNPEINDFDPEEKNNSVVIIISNGRLVAKKIIKSLRNFSPEMLHKSSGHVKHGKIAITAKGEAEKMVSVLKNVGIKIIYH